MSDSLSGNYSFENGLMMLIGKEFGGAPAGFSIRWEAKNFRPSKFGDKFLKEVYDQATGRAPKIAEVYFRGQFICDVSEAMQPEQVKQKIQERLIHVISKRGGAR